MVRVMVRVFGCGFALSFILRVEIRELEDVNLALSTQNGQREGDGMD